MQDINQILDQFETISLAEMESVKLMDRTDTKFSFSIGQLPNLLQKLKPDYKVLLIENKTIARYKTLYFDTPDYQLYLSHHNGHLNRYKIRYRRYEESNLGFLEVKLKNNKGRTQKERIKQKGEFTELNEASRQFISSKLPIDLPFLEPSIWVNYQRITLVGKESMERVTLDVHLEFIKEATSKKVENLVIAEVKQPGKNSTPVLKRMRELRLRPVSLSKYCMGMAYLNPQLKQNNFKEKLIYLNKIIHDQLVKLASGF